MAEVNLKKRDCRKLHVRMDVLSGKSRERDFSPSLVYLPGPRGLLVGSVLNRVGGLACWALYLHCKTKVSQRGEGRPKNERGQEPHRLDYRPVVASSSARNRGGEIC